MLFQLSSGPWFREVLAKFAPALALSFAMTAPTLLLAQNNKGTTDSGSDKASIAQETTTEQISIPQANLLEIVLKSPTQVRVGDSFNFEVEVKNVSSDVSLHDVKLASSSQSSVSIESGKVLPRRPQSSHDGSKKTNRSSANQNSDSGDQSGSQANSSQESGEGENQSGKNSDQKNEKNSSNNDQSDQGSNNSSWTIDSLAPGESRTLRVKAVSDDEGSSHLCLVVESYKTGICKQLEVVKPELELVKKAPQEGSICQPIRYVYTIQNTGSGDYTSFVIQDELAEGLLTETGDKQLRFKVDGLAAGETRRFAANITATKRGEFTSRAVAKVSGNDEARSKKTTTKVTAPEIDLRIDARSKGYVDAPIDVDIYVENTGDQRTEETELTLNFPSSLEMVDAGEVEKVEAKGEQSSNNSDSPEQANSDSGQSSGNSNKNNDSSSSDLMDNSESETWSIGSLEPGEARQVTVTLQGEGRGRLNLKAVAEFFCAAAEDLEETKTQAVAEHTMRIVAVPALLVSVVDEEGVVVVGNEVVYTITVKNQGQRADNDVQLEITLPEQLEFVELNGPSDPNRDGNKLTLKPSDKLNPGDSLTWELKATAKAAGTVKLKSKLTSKSLPDGVVSEESTRLVK